MNKKTLCSLIFIALFVFPITINADFERLDFSETIESLNIIIGIFVYIFNAIAFMMIAKKTNTEPAWLAWVPIANIYLISKIARAHWWPVLSSIIMIPAIIIGLVTGNIGIIIVGILTGLFLAITVIVWEWKVFVRMGYPGWWVLSFFTPMIGPYIFVFLLMVVALKSNSESDIHNNKMVDTEK